MAANLSPAAQTLVDASKRAYKTELVSFKNYSNEEIQELMYDAIQKGLAANNIVEQCEFIGKKQACEEILEERKTALTNNAKAEEEWPDIMHKLQNEAVLNLKTSITANAQLIAAVLEEEGDLSEEELSGWCDELASIPEYEFRQLLSGMEEEKVISRKDGKYHLLNICTPSLFPENIEWFMQLKDYKGDEEMKALMVKVMHMLLALGPKTADGIPAAMEIYAKVFPDDVLNEDNFKDQSLLKSPGSAVPDPVTRRLFAHGLLRRYRTSCSPVYYFPMLGLKEDE